MFFDNGFRNKIYFVVCPLCKGDENINCEVCFNERRRLFYIPAVPLKSITIVWADNTAKRVEHYVDEKGMFSLEMGEAAYKSLTNMVDELEELVNINVSGNSGKHENELIIEMNECG